MEINVKDSSNTGEHKVIILGSSDHTSQLNDAEKSIIDAFSSSDKDTLFVDEISSSKFLVKSKDDHEKMRGFGAEYRSKLDKNVEAIQIIGSEEDVYYFLEGLLLASYQFLKYFKDQDKKKYKLEIIAVPDSVTEEKIQELLDIQKAVFWSRDMVNEPVSYLNAEQLAQEIVCLADDAPLDIKVLEKVQIESLKMGGLLAVNKGSVDQPTFSIVEYKPENPVNKKPIVLVGKGVVYDTGGLSLKPTANSMDIMKSDMGGAACMAGAIYLAAKQQLPVHLVALIPATDNRPGLNAYAPGDVITMYNGTTVEVLNTDAEGRMILADALSYSEKFDPELVIDAATLTGAAVRAIGTHASIVMGNAEDKYFDQLESAGNSTHERVVKFPFWDDYMEEMKSPIADLKNLGGPYAGMITAGKFLEHFVKAPYIHMDIAGPAWLDSTKSYRTKGGTGTGVRLLYQFLKNYA